MNLGVSFIFTAIFVVLIGLTVFLPARKARNHDRIRESWPTAKGTVTSSNVVAATMAVREKREPVLYEAVVKYQFRAGGQLKFADTVAFPRQLWSEKEAGQISARYPAGAEVTVHYNLENPLECYLEFIPSREARNYNLGILIFAGAGVIVVLGLLGLIQ
jgi:hypothetical protein